MLNVKCVVDGFFGCHDFDNAQEVSLTGKPHAKAVLRYDATV